MFWVLFILRFRGLDSGELVLERGERAWLKRSRVGRWDRLMEFAMENYVHGAHIRSLETSLALEALRVEE
jgi:hypothetical protein